MRQSRILNRVLAYLRQKTDHIDPLSLVKFYLEFQKFYVQLLNCFFTIPTNIIVAPNIGSLDHFKKSISMIFDKSQFTFSHFRKQGWPYKKAH